ncbi:hypothetical protein [Bacillus wiedmannii]|uniref:hypothetical protein n=1 Tax=Bacillus wiedmannii TaxID=1890302 RepID=UPI000BEF99AF|nr:hypothetical protein [Bacillus wiedmannii]PEL85531.1 hypothetical protein CN626_27620 [Bacillus wiedmannii]
MPMERVSVTGNTLEEAEGKFEWEMTKKNLIYGPKEKEVIDCTDADTDYNWMIVYKPYGF